MPDTNERTNPSRDEIRDQALRWVILVNRDTPPTAEEVEDLKRWAGQSSTHLEELRRAERTWTETSAVMERIITGTGVQETDTRYPYYESAQNWSNWRRVAAILLLLPLVALISTNWFTNAPVGNTALITDVGEIRPIPLEDGSIVYLDTDSAIEIHYSESERGISLLKGQAHFDVAKNTDRPFIVATEAGRIRAVGTAFTVSLREQLVNVAVTEGVVEVESASNLSAITFDKRTTTVSRLEVGKRLEFGSNTQRLSIMGQNELEKEKNWKEGILVFEGETVAEALDELLRYSHTKVSIPDPEIRNLSIGGRFRATELDAFLETLADTFDLAISYTDSEQVTITARK